MSKSWWLQVIRRAGRPISRSERRQKLQSRTWLRLEGLEGRDVPSVSAIATPDYVVHDHAGTATPNATTGPTGYSPTQIRQAYGFNQISFNGTAGTGAGTTIAIVDAYNDPNIKADLHAFDTQFGLADPSFSVVNETGGSSLPASNTGWAGEISLDVEWAHAIAPGAKILLVEANSSSYSDLFAAVQYAAKQSGVVAVSMSWGGSEFSGETSYDNSVFVAPASNPDVVFVNSSGDSGAPASYPSTSPNVLSVGGTSLNLTSSSSYSSESAWSGSGGGLSSYESQPAFQKGVVTQSMTARANPDVAYDADPNTGFPVYQTYGNSASTPWLQYGGTSDAAPQWAALIAIADQGRAAAGESALTSSALLSTLYKLPSADFHDVTTGSSTGSPSESAAKGYDLATGLGTPVANLVVSGLVGVTNPNAVTHLSITAPSTANAGSSFSVTIKALTASGAVSSSYTGTVAFTSSDILAGLPAIYTFTSTDAGSHTFTITLKTAGTETVTVADTSNSSISGQSQFTVYPGGTTHLVFLQQPGSVTIGGTISPAVTVEELDPYNNVVTTDSSSQISLALGANPGSATLTGGGTATVSHGVATFSSLMVSAIGTGYTLVATSGSLSATSSAFSVAANNPSAVLENFANGLGNYYYEGNSYPNVATSTYAAHPGTSNAGLADGGDGNWYFRMDSGAVVNPGDTLSAWVQLAGSANGRAYIGFGTTLNGTDSVVLAPNTGQFLIQNNAGFTAYTDLAAANQTYSANSWYRVEIDWGTSGTVVAKLFASNGTTLLNTVTAATGDTTPGWFAFRAIGSTKYFATVTDNRGVNNLAATASVHDSISTPQTEVSTHTGTTTTSTACYTAAGMSNAAAVYAPSWYGVWQETHSSLEEFWFGI